MDETLKINVPPLQANMQKSLMKIFHLGICSKINIDTVHHTSNIEHIKCGKQNVFFDAKEPVRLGHDSTVELPQEAIMFVLVH